MSEDDVYISSVHQVDGLLAEADETDVNDIIGTTFFTLGRSEERCFEGICTRW